MPYLWERANWPNFIWNSDKLLSPLAAARHGHGLFLGRMRGLGFEVTATAEVEALTTEVVKSSEIEGEHLNPQSVRSSLARRLGVPHAGVTAPDDQRVEGVVQLMLDATRTWAQPLSEDQVLGWHAALFPTGYSGLHRVRVGSWRDDAHGPMQVVSGRVDSPRVHYEAPPAQRVPAEMRRFLDWFNGPSTMDPLLRAAVAHLWFVTVHPLDDGNGRIARAITERALGQLEQSAQRFYSLSSQIRTDRARYYEVLEATQKGDLDVTGWLLWFLSTFESAIEAATTTLGEVLQRAEFWARHATADFNPRQRKVLGAFVAGFEGALTAKKWAALAKCSVDTAQRDLADLVTRGVLTKNPGGSRKTSYALVR